MMPKGHGAIEISSYFTGLDEGSSPESGREDIHGNLKVLELKRKETYSTESKTKSYEETPTEKVE